MRRPKYSYALSLTPFALVPEAAKGHPVQTVSAPHCRTRGSVGSKASLFIDTARRPLR